MIVIDTSVLSEAFRHRRGIQPTRSAEELVRLIRDGESLAVPGVVLQEFLAGLRDEALFLKLAGLLRPLPLLLATHENHVAAARISNSCRAAGIAAGAVDCLIAAQALGRDHQLFSSDRDFERIAEVCELQLYLPMN